MSIQKTVWCLRHGLSLHNVMYKTMGMSAYTELEDTNLLEDGFIQAKNTNKNWKEINNIDIVYVSPLTRTIQTALNIFRGIIPPLGGIDISSLLAFLILGALQNFITIALNSSIGYL